MTTKMNQVTCSLCNKKTDELECMYHLVSTNHLPLCKKKKKIKLNSSFLKRFLTHIPIKVKNIILKLKEHLISGRYFLQQVYQKKKAEGITAFDLLCSDSINDSELEDSLTSDLLSFIQNSTHDFGETYFKSLDKVKFYQICSIEINKSLLYDHNNSKKHRDIEDCVIGKCMNFCEKRKREIKKRMKGVITYYQRNI